jgi:transcriptional regulator with XRE-family HTH domain
MNIGKRIRDVRENKGQSIRKVAAASGLSASLISQIETGKVDPSLSTLRKIAISLDVPLFNFVLGDDSGPARLIKRDDRRLVAFPKAGLQYEIIHSDQNKKMAIMIGTLTPDGATSDSPLNHPGEECLVILEGVMKVQVGEEAIELSEGDSLYFDSSVPHRLCNDREKDCKFYLIITPPKF